MVKDGDQNGALESGVNVLVVSLLACAVGGNFWILIFIHCMNHSVYGSFMAQGDEGVNRETVGAYTEALGRPTLAIINVYENSTNGKTIMKESTKK